MRSHDYLIVGGGMTAAAAVDGLREVDADGSIGLIGSEEEPPYDRPPLSKGLWRGGREEDDIWRGTDERADALHLGRQAVSLDPQAKTVTDHRGDRYEYDRLLLATGGRPRRLPDAPDGVVHFRTVNDYRRLRALADERGHFVVVGGGFIGSELAAALTGAGCEVTVVFPDQGLSARIFPAGLSRFVTEYYRDQGVTVREGEAVAGVSSRGEGWAVELESGATLKADGVVVGIGIVPEVDLAREAGLEVSDGIVVDDRLRTSAADVFAAGDVASFPHPALGRHTRVEHEDAANTMGRQAGRNMAEADEAYDHVPIFYSDLFDLGYEAVGRVDARLDVVEDWTEENREGVVYYLADGRLEGVLLWNVWGQADAARRLLGEDVTASPEELRGRITS